jgi:hypothetical protein
MGCVDSIAPRLPCPSAICATRAEISRTTRCPRGSDGSPPAGRSTCAGNASRATRAAAAASRWANSIRERNRASALCEPTHRPTREEAEPAEAAASEDCTSAKGDTPAAAPKPSEPPSASPLDTPPAEPPTDDEIAHPTTAIAQQSATTPAKRRIDPISPTPTSDHPQEQLDFRREPIQANTLDRLPPRQQAHRGSDSTRPVARPQRDVTL